MPVPKSGSCCPRGAPPPAPRRRHTTEPLARNADWQGQFLPDRRDYWRAEFRLRAQGRFDVLMAWSIDQLGHRLQDLAVTFAQLQNAGVDLYLKEVMVDTSTPSGRILCQAIGMFAQFERALARKRVQVGVARARKAGKPFGRPKSLPTAPRRSAPPWRAGSAFGGPRSCMASGSPLCKKLAVVWDLVQFPERRRDR
jgi:hypothetical protein